VGGDRELVLGQWALIPHFAKTAKLAYQTNNARAEELASKASFREPWLRGQRCIIPAASFDEPCWETGKNVWWRFRRTDGAPWGIAGLFNPWTDPTTGEVIESYTMLTLNADHHPLMRRMHKPKPDRPAAAQDKRSVIPIEVADVDQWLSGSLEDATQLLRLAPVEIFDAGPIVRHTRGGSILPPLLGDAP
jgi:putative SOS response-associated peptidase YedK